MMRSEPTLPQRGIAAVELAENDPTIQKLNDRILRVWAHLLLQPASSCVGAGA